MKIFISDDHTYHPVYNIKHFKWDKEHNKLTPIVSQISEMTFQDKLDNSNPESLYGSPYDENGNSNFRINALGKNKRIGVVMIKGLIETRIYHRLIDVLLDDDDQFMIDNRIYQSNKNIDDMIFESAEMKFPILDLTSLCESV